MEESPLPDLIVRLAGRVQCEAIGIIFSMLNYEDFRNIEKVSPEWKSVISSTAIYWRNLLKRNKALNRQWQYMHQRLLSKESDWISKFNRSEVDRWICFEIVNSLQRVHENWSTGAHTTLEEKVVPFGDNLVTTSNGVLFSLMNSRAIAGGFQDENHPEHHIQLWNRWTLQSELVLGHPFMTNAGESRPADTLPSISCILLSEEVLVGRYHPNRICIWSLDTKLLVWQTTITEITAENYVPSIPMQVRLRGRNLVIKATVSQGDNICTTFFTLKLTKAGLPADEKKFLFDINIARDVGLPTNINGVKDFELDDDYVIVFYVRNFLENHYELRSQSTGALITEILLGEDVFAAPVTFTQFEPIIHSDGLLITGQFTNRLRIWNLLNGTCVGALLDTEKIKSACFIQDQFIITSNYDGYIKVWDLQMALRPSPSNVALRMESLLVNASNKPDDFQEPQQRGLLFRILQHIWEAHGSTDVLVDDYQIVRFKIRRDESQDADVDRSLYPRWFEVLDFAHDHNLEQLTEMLTRSGPDENIFRGVPHEREYRTPRRRIRQPPQPNQPQQNPPNNNPEPNQPQQNPPNNPPQMDPAECIIL